jgi:hypothetical protein
MSGSVENGGQDGSQGMKITDLAGLVAQQMDPAYLRKTDI